MRRQAPPVSTRTQEIVRRELPLTDPPAPPPPTVPERRPADRIKDALLRWLEEEM
jgi:hypothetical protein